MSIIQKKNKISINFHSSGTFLNLNKPKLLFLNKLEKKNITKIKVKNSNHNISQDITPVEIFTKFNENNNKDEEIKFLKEHLIFLEKKIKILEKEKNLENNESNINRFNISQDSKQKNNKIKLNLKFVKSKSKKNIIKIFNHNINNIHFNLNNKIKNNNFINLFFNNNGNMKKNNYENKISHSESKNITQKCVIIPRKKLFDNALKKALIKYSSIDSYKLQNHNIKNYFNKNIIKIPKRIKSYKSIIINYSIDNNKYNELTESPKIKDISIYNNKIINSEKNEFSLINNRDNDNDFSNDFNFELSNDSKFNGIINKLENIKIRTQNLLEYYFSKKSNNENIDWKNDKYGIFLPMMH